MQGMFVLVRCRNDFSAEFFIYKRLVFMYRATFNSVRPFIRNEDGQLMSMQ